MVLDHSRELLSRRCSSLVTIVVSDLEVPKFVSAQLTGSNIRRGWIVLLAGASTSWSSTSDLFSFSLELCNICDTALTDPKRVFRLGGTKNDIASTFTASSVKNSPASNSSTSNLSSRSWKTVHPGLCSYAVKSLLASS